MRSPISSKLEIESSNSKKPEGGKARQRYLHFHRVRGWTEEPGAQSRTTKSRNNKSNLSASKTVSQEYLDVALALQEANSRPSTSVATADSLLHEMAPAPGPVPTPPSWRSLGPVFMPNGQTYSASRVNVAGRVAAIAVDPFDSNHLLVGSAAGGVWESRNRGVSWLPRTDNAPTLTVGAIAFDPSTPNVVYTGTGEGNFYSRLGAGVLRSIDGGASWTSIATNPFVGQGFYDLIVDRADPQHLLAATSFGMYESRDRGVTWAQRRASQTWDLSIHPAGGATAEVFAACRDGLFRSVNSGTTWSAVALPGAPAGWDRLAVAHAPSNPAIAYAFGASGGRAYLYRRSVAGVWQAVVAPATPTGQAWYDWFLTIATDNPDQIYLGAIEVTRGDLVGTSWTWAPLSGSAKAGDNIHPDQHALTVDPRNPNTLYVGNDGGLYRSTDRGVHWESLNQGLAITEIEYIAQDWGSSRWLMAGTQDNGTIRYTGSAIWDHIQDGDGGDCTVNRANPDHVFHSFYSMGLERSTTKGNFGSFSGMGPSVPSGYSALFYPPMESNGTTIAQAGQSVFVSRNEGTSWAEIALPVGAVASAMIIPTPNRVFVGTTDGRLFRLDWGGAAWSAATELTRPRSAYMSDLSVDAASPNRIWATFLNGGGGRVFRSDNGGVSWIDCSAGLPNLPMNAVEVDPSNANRVWVAADLGVYQTFDAGATWSSFSIGLPNVLVADLLFHPHARVLRAGTRNRGVWEIPVDGWLASPICGTQWNGTLAANQTQSWFTFNWPATWHMLWTVMPTSVRPGAPQLNWKVQVERASPEFVTYWISVTNLTGSAVNFEGRFAILSKY